MKLLTPWKWFVILIATLLAIEGFFIAFCWHLLASQPSSLTP